MLINYVYFLLKYSLYFYPDRFIAVKLAISKIFGKNDVKLEIVKNIVFFILRIVLFYNNK